jgi:hypothetical protein
MFTQSLMMAHYGTHVYSFFFNKLQLCLAVFLFKKIILTAHVINSLRLVQNYKSLRSIYEFHVQHMCPHNTPLLGFK